MSTAIEIGGASTIGKRERQEDCFMAYHMVEELPKKHQRFILSTDRNVCMGVLCDGMGGEGQGDFCARQAIQAYGETFAETGSFNTMWKERMFMSLYAANAAVHDFKESVHKKESQSGCTLVSAVISDDELHYVSVGDSYILLFRKDKSVGHYKEHQLNQRHIQGKKYTTSEDGEVHEESISEEEEKDLKQNGLPAGIRIRHSVTSAILGAEINKLECQTGIKLVDGDIVILASDGILQGLGDIERENTVDNYSEVSAQQLAQELIRKIETTIKPKQDNASCVVLKVSID